MKKPHYYGHRERLRKKYSENGINSLSKHEIIELLLTFTIPVKDTKEPAKSLLKKYGSIKNIFYHLDKENFEAIKGIGEKSFILFRLINDIFKIISEEELTSKTKISSPEEVINYCRKTMWNLKNEVFKIIFLNSKNEILKIENVEQGTINEAYIYFRKIFEKAFNVGATAMILIHNHPSGKEEPSKADIDMTKKVINLAENLNITVHDHIIITSNDYFSFKERGIM